MMGWTLLVGGGLLAVIPGMFTHTVNGGSLLGLLVSVVGAMIIGLGVKQNVGS